jgi:ubiquinone/menaquinone biosynthesis C-methylase UbiE
MMMSRRPPVTNEIKRAGISSTDKILVIGCGILPSTIIILAEETQAYLTGIDINSKITNLAKSYINKKRFSNRIDILVGDGVNYPVNEFDVIFIAINVWPINQILQHLAQNMKSGSKFIYREFESDSSLVSSEEKIFTSFTLDSSFNYPMTMFSKYPMTKSFLFIKN